MSSRDRPVAPDLTVELLVLCEKVTADESGRPVLERAFGHLEVERFPRTISCALYAEVWGAPFLTVRFHGRIEDPHGTALAEHSPNGIALDDDGVALFAFPLESVTIAEPGVHAAVLLADGEVLARRRFLVAAPWSRSTMTGTM